MLSAVLCRALLACLAVKVLATPSPTTLGSDLTLLFQNNLNWTEASQHQGAILLSPRNNADAVAACSQIGETLLVSNSTFFSSDFTNSLAYLAYDGRYPFLQRYWISSSDGACWTLGPFAALSTVDCGLELPVLCSQSAPASVPSNSTGAAVWELDVQSQGLTITGTRNQQSFRFFGIPYANQPERFTYSTLYTGPPNITATMYGSECTQVGGGSEDCLFLNIYTPYIPHPTRSPSSALKPVLFYIHGGSFTSGTGNDPTYDGGSLTSRGDIVEVAINYRLSTLGFLALNDGVTKGNFGLADQITALDWVRQHIQAFGGDPDRITIAGQSAGAASVRALLGSPMAIGKFQAAIPQSNLAGSDYATTYSLYYSIEEEVQVAADAIMNATGCNCTDNVATLACLRAYNPLDLVNLPTVARYVVVDGTYITSPQLPLNGSGPIANVHTMMGFMRDDGAIFISYPTSGDLSQEITANITYDNQTTASIITSGLFPEPQSSNATLDVFNTTSRIATDVMFRCLDQATAVAAAKRNLFRSLWFYQFNRSYQVPGNPVCDAPSDAGHPYGDPSQEYFHCHAGELHYVFGTLAQFNLPFRDANDLAFTQQAVDQWSAFVRTYDPNPDPLYLAVRGYTSTAAAMLEDGPWLPIPAAESPSLRLLAVPSMQGRFEDGPQCDFFNYSLTYYE